MGGINMPYVNLDIRDKYSGGLSEIFDAMAHDLEGPSSGEWNYLFTSLAVAYLNEKGLSYPIINEILGAFDGASKEFYRRIAVPYENKKRGANGDVYELE